MAFTPIDPLKAEVRVIGEAPNQSLDFYIPRGPKGDPGGIVLGTVLGSTDLDTVVASGIYRQTSPTEAQVARNYPKEALAGVLRVYERQSGFLWQEYEGLTGGQESRVWYKRSNSGGVWTPWRVYSPQRIDQTAGRAVYMWDDVNSREQLIYGDTGWRDVTASTANVVAGNIYIRRTGQTVFLVMNGAQFATAQDTAGIAGFRTGLSLYSPPVDVASLSGAPRRVLILNAAGWRIPDAVAMNFSMSFPTNDAWPTTLPGTALGSIPNL